MAGFMGGGYNGPQKVEYLFIDGGCLRNILNDYSSLYFNNTPIEFDFRRLTSSFTKVFYYDSMPPKKKDEADSVYQERTKETKNLFDQLEEIDRIHVYQGNAHTRKKRVEQKQVDMMIAIDMLTHTFRGNMHQATLFTSDSDFIPLIDTLVQNGMFITLWYGETANCRTSKELKGAADARKRLNIHDIYHNCTPSFKKKFKLPSVEHRPKFENAILLQQWHDDEKGTIELMKIEQEFAVVFEENEPSSNFIHLRLHDLQQLKMYAQDLYGIQVPDSNN